MAKVLAVTAFDMVLRGVSSMLLALAAVGELTVLGLGSIGRRGVPLGWTRLLL
jgi:hypothetical protein